MPYFVGYQIMVILDTSGTGFHGVIVYVVFDITEGPHLTRILGLEKTRVTQNLR